MNLEIVIFIFILFYGVFGVLWMIENGDDVSDVLFINKTIKVKEILTMVIYLPFTITIIILTYATIFLEEIKDFLNRKIKFLNKEIKLRR